MRQNGKAIELFGAKMKDWLCIQSYVYAREKDKPVQGAEFMLAKNGEVAYFYALRILRGRFKLGEKAIADCPEWALKYARFIIKRRFRIAEDKIARDPKLCYLYFKHVVRKKLPPKMHRVMVSSGFKFADNQYIARYLQEIGALK